MRTRPSRHNVTRPPLPPLTKGGRPRQLYCLALAAVAACLLSSAARSEPAPPKATGEREPAGADEAGWQKLFREMAEDYDMASVDKPSRKFLLQSAPVLRWSQPVRGGDDGAVYIWVDEGRPAAIGSIFA